MGKDEIGEIVSKLQKATPSENKMPVLSTYNSYIMDLLEFAAHVEDFQFSIPLQALINHALKEKKKMPIITRQYVAEAMVRLCSEEKAYIKTLSSQEDILQEINFNRGPVMDRLLYYPSQSVHDGLVKLRDAKKKKLLSEEVHYITQVAQKIRNGNFDDEDLKNLTSKNQENALNNFLLTAAENKQWEILNKLQKKIGSDSIMYSKQGMSLFECALESMNDQGFPSLLMYSNKFSKSNWMSIFSWAEGRDNLAFVKLLFKEAEKVLEKGKIINILNDQRLLLSALKEKRWKIAEELIKYGCRTNIISRTGWSALELIFLGNQTNLINLMSKLEQNNENQEMANANKIWSCFCSKENLTPETISALKNQKKDGYIGDACFRLELGHYLVGAMSNNLRKSIRLLLQAGASARARDPKGNELLARAANAANVKMIKLLVKEDAGLKANTRAYFQLITEICAKLRSPKEKKKAVLALKALIDLCPSPNILSYQKSNLLHEVICWVAPEITKSLIENKINIEGEGVWNNRSPLFSALQWDDEESAKYLVEAGANVYARDSEGQLPIHVAVRKGHISLISK